MSAASGAATSGLCRRRPLLRDGGCCDALNAHLRGLELGVDFAVRECVKPRSGRHGSNDHRLLCSHNCSKQIGLPLWVLAAGVSEDEHPTPRRNSGYVVPSGRLAFSVRTEAWAKGGRCASEKGAVR